jgi:hypothetical protein
MGKGFYERLKESRKDDTALSSCIERVVDQLDAESTSSDRPGMLLGKIQAGKTRAFIGVIAKAFDKDFDIAVVFTKGTKTLSKQTVARICSDFADFINDDEILVHDIMNLPGRLTKGELQRKFILVAKKQAANLKRVLEFFKESYPDLKNRRILLIDDEADLASVRFVKKREAPDVEQGAIATQLDELRRVVSKVAILQVTATPYSLYLQPEKYDATNPDGFVFKPKRPAFTELLPIHSDYVGGDDYFGHYESTDPRSYLFVEVAKTEQDSLRQSDQRRINRDRILDTPNIVGLRRAIITFILAVRVRRWQQESHGERQLKYVMVIHNDTQKKSHAWQETVINWIFEGLEQAAKENPEQLRNLFDAAYEDLEKSLNADGGNLPNRKDAFSMLAQALRSQDVVREKVNSDADVLALLDDKGELKLRTAYNIYVGGNILDRGITIPNLISFYYGRNPKTMQADTVLQHSRMYGKRDRRDLAATRLYTSREVYDRLYKIHALETALREAFEKGAHEQGVVFIQADTAHRVKPCAPNKILLSDVVTVRPNSLFLPTGFQIKPQTAVRPIVKKLDEMIAQCASNDGQFVEIDRASALDIIWLTEQTMDFEDEEFEWDAFRGLIDYYSEFRKEGEGSVLLMILTGRRLSREKSGDKSGLSIIGAGPARSKVLEASRSKPALIVIRQDGDRDLGWTGHPFWWPILAAPGIVEPCVFATKVTPD